MFHQRTEGLLHAQLYTDGEVEREDNIHCCHRKPRGGEDRGKHLYHHARQHACSGQIGAVSTSIRQANRNRTTLAVGGNQFPVSVAFLWGYLEVDAKLVGPATVDRRAEESAIEQHRRVHRGVAVAACLKRILDALGPGTAGH